MATLGFFANYPVDAYYIEGNSALIMGRSDNPWIHIVGTSKEEISTLLAKYHHLSNYYYSLEDWMLPLVLSYGSQDWVMRTNRFVLEKDHPVPRPKANIEKIDPSHASFMFSNSDYKEYLSVAYIEDRLNKDISAGILLDDMLVAWGFTHDDGALGFLHVMDEHRGKGYGLEILRSLIKSRMKENKAVFGNIVPDNTASMNLVSKLGFTLDRSVSWIKLL